MSSPADLTAPADTLAAKELLGGFGIPVELAPDAWFPGLAPAPTADRRLPTRVRRAGPGELDATWADANPRLVREVRESGTLLFEVRQDERLGFLLDAPALGRFAVAPDGGVVVCAPHGEGWRAIIAAQLLPLAATLRGLEVFHASGVVRNGRSVLLCADPGVGKTSVAAHLVLAGSELLSDDAVAVDERLRAHAGSRLLHLRQAEFDLLSAAQQARLRPRSDADRDRTFEPSSGAAAPAPLGAIYLLVRADCPRAIERLPAVDPLLLLGATFNLSVRTPERLTRQLDLCAAIAESVPIYRATVAPGLSAAELAGQVARHLDAEVGP
jgi:hypothetical protein